ncbi:PspA-associated protein PspAA [Nocardioides sp. LHG3406-4]|uniref:PspA-associated protein PspAA n=1 Tax=Nocardioides sp. LHG3406-4 TaxID=2804575 RepID=UPI003CE9E5AE
MIVRILTEGQFDVSDEALSALNQLDSAVESAIDAGDEEAFRTALAALLDGVRTVGVPHEADSLDESDLILPPSDATLDEVRQLLSDDGLIPG